MTHEERERLIRLQAASLHEAGNATPGIEVTKGEFMEHVMNSKTLIAYVDKGILIIYRRTDEHWSGTHHVGDFQSEQLDELIALLQRAKQIMQGGA